MHSKCVFLPEMNEHAALLSVVFILAAYRWCEQQQTHITWSSDNLTAQLELAPRCEFQPVQGVLAPQEYPVILNLKKLAFRMITYMDV